MARFRCRACGEEGTFVYTGGMPAPAADPATSSLRSRSKSSPTTTR